jgi:Anti-sigma-K factor rskA
MISDDDRIAYLAGDVVESITAQDRAELDELRALLKDPTTWEEPDPSLSERVVAVIAEEARAQSPQRRARGRLRLPAFQVRPLLRRPAYIVAATAAAAAFVVAVTINDTTSSPESFATLLSGTTLAPRAHGNATLTKTNFGWRIQLSASGLPRLDDGRYYQAWLKNATGILVPVGTFNQPVDVTLWSGVPATSFPTLTVTQQLANGNPASSGKRVLVGVIRVAR